MNNIAEDFNITDINTYIAEQIREVRDNLTSNDYGHVCKIRQIVVKTEQRTEECKYRTKTIIVPQMIII